MTMASSQPGPAGGRQPVPPGWPRPPGGPSRPGPVPPGPPSPGRPQPPKSYPPVDPSRAWLAPAELPSVTERLLLRRIVLAHGLLDGEAATRLCAQLLTLDAEGDDPIRLELQGLSSELPAALTVMGVLDVVGVPVRGLASGQLGGAALGVLACCSERRAYPSAVFALAEPRAEFAGTVTELTAQEQQVDAMVDALLRRLAEVTGREIDEVRADTRQRRVLTAGQAVDYGLVQGLVMPRR